MKQRDYLTKRGWVQMFRRKNGCILTVHWKDPVASASKDGVAMHEIWSQGVAVEIQRRRDLARITTVEPKQ